jgi:hypothetical protein
MKKFTFLTILFLTIISSIKAQTTDQLIDNFKILLVESRTDFKNIQGGIVENDAGSKTAYYSCKPTLGSPLEAICINSNDNTSFFSAKYDYAKTDELIKASEILPGVLDVVNAMVQSGSYKGRDYTNSNNVGVTEVTDLLGNYILEIETGADNTYLRITIFGKSWGKK